MSSVVSTVVDVNSVLSTMRIYQPAFQMADVQKSVAFVSANNAKLGLCVLATIQQQGMSYWLNVVKTQRRPY